MPSQPVAGSDVGGMHEDGDAEALDRLEKMLELRLVEILSVDVRANLEAVKPELADHG